MKQENGAELLGMNDPRSANIGIIYVDPTDDRRRVLAAILTQEKLGRKQIAIVLPPQNKAFQRPSDFDDLKTIRRNLEAQIVFIAPSGPGPAEFARQRHFAVYSTLENFATALRDGNVSSGVKKGGWLFHRGKNPAPSPGGTRFIPSDLSPADAIPTSHDESGSYNSSKGVNRLDSKPKSVNTPPGTASTVSTPPQSSMSANGEEEDDDQDIHTDPLKSMARGAAAFGAGMLAADMVKQGSAKDEPASSFPAHHEDDWDALPPTSGSSRTGQPGAAQSIAPVPLASTPSPIDEHSHDVADPVTNPPGKSPVQGSAAGVAESAKTGGGQHAPAANAGGPGIIELGPRRQKVTAKLSPADLAGSGAAKQSASANAAAKANKARTTGKMGAAAMAGAGMGPSGMATGSPAQRMGGVGNFPPPPGPGRGGRGGGPGRGPRPRRALVALVVVIILVLLIGGASAVAFMNPNMFRQASSVLSGGGSPTVTITPDSKLISNSYVIQGVPGTPNPAQRQIAVRSLTATAKSDPKTVNATGHTKTPGTLARGQLTFLNGSFSKSYTVGTLTAIPVGNVSLFLDVPAVIPPASGSFGTVTVSAHASVPGAAGNIGAHAADQVCCSPTGDVTVKNNNPFTGGQDPQNYNFVQQSDVDGVANPLKNTVSAQAQTSLQGQLHTGEQLVAQNGANLCPSRVNTDSPVGPHGVNVNTVTVTVTATCNALAYDHAGLQTMIANLLASKANNDIGTTFKLAGQVVMNTTVQNIDQQGNVSLLVNAKGIWVAQISDAEVASLAKAIAGKTVAQAQDILAGHKDIGHVDIQTNGGNVLPSDPNQIKIVIQNVPGVQDTATPTPGGPGSSTPVNNPSGTQTPLPGNG